MYPSLMKHPMQLHGCLYCYLELLVLLLCCYCWLPVLLPRFPELELLLCCYP